MKPAVKAENSFEYAYPYLISPIRMVIIGRMEPAGVQHTALTSEKFHELPVEQRRYIRERAKILVTSALRFSENEAFEEARHVVMELLSYFPRTFDRFETNPLIGVNGALSSEAFALLRLAQEELRAAGKTSLPRLCGALSRVAEIIPPAPLDERMVFEKTGINELSLPHSAYGIAYRKTNLRELEAFGDSDRNAPEQIITVVSRRTGRAAEKYELVMPSASCIGAFNYSGDILMLRSNAGPDHPATGAWAVFLNKPGGLELEPHIVQLSHLPCVVLCGSVYGGRVALVEAECDGKYRYSYRMQHFRLVSFEAPIAYHTGLVEFKNGIPALQQQEAARTHLRARGYSKLSAFSSTVAICAAALVSATEDWDEGTATRTIF
jgi:hypothetical protein